MDDSYHWNQTNITDVMHMLTNRIFVLVNLTIIFFKINVNSSSRESYMLLNEYEIILEQRLADVNISFFSKINKKYFQQFF